MGVWRLGNPLYYNCHQRCNNNLLHLVLFGPNIVLIAPSSQMIPISWLHYLFNYFFLFDWIISYNFSVQQQSCKSWGEDDRQTDSSCYLIQCLDIDFVYYTVFFSS